MIMNRGCGCVQAELAELVDALDSGSSVRKDFRVQVPGSAFKQRQVRGESWATEVSDLPSVSLRSTYMFCKLCHKISINWS